MKTRSHKKYIKRGVTKSRRNKVGGLNILSFFGFGQAPVSPVATRENDSFSDVTRVKPCPQGPVGETEIDKKKRCDSYFTYKNASIQEQAKTTSFVNPLGPTSYETTSSSPRTPRTSFPPSRIGGKRTRKYKKSKRSKK